MKVHIPAFEPLGTGLVTPNMVSMSAGNAKEIVTMLTIRLCSADQMIFAATASAWRIRSENFSSLRRKPGGDD